MSDLDQDLIEAEKALLNSARLDETSMPKDAQLRLLAGLGISGAVSGVSTVASAAVGAAASNVVRVTTLGIIKWAAVGATAGALTLGAATHRVQRTSGSVPTPALSPMPEEPGATPRSRPPLTATASPLAEPVSPLAEPVAPLAEPVAPLAEPVSPHAEPVSPLAEPVSPHAKPVSPRGEPAEPLPSDTAPSATAVTPRERSPIAARAAERTQALAAEVDGLDQVRKVLASGEPRAALRLLDAHQLAFPGGHLAPEATYLRVQLLLKTGNRPAALDLARRFVAAYPQSPQAPALREIAAEQDRQRAP